MQNNNYYAGNGSARGGQQPGRPLPQRNAGQMRSAGQGQRPVTRASSEQYERRRPTTGRKKKKKNNASSVLLAVLLIARIIIFIITLITVLTGKKPPEETDEPAPVSDTAKSTTPVTSPPETTPIATTPPVTLPPETTPPVTVPPVTSPPVTSPPETVPPVPVTGDNARLKYPYTNKLPENGKVTDEFFKDAVFIGDSRMKGMMLFGTIKGCDWYATESLHITSVDKTKFYTEDGVDYTAMEMLKKNSAKFKKIYLSLGVNDLGYSVGNFVSYYSGVINTVRSINQSADIYVMAILPISKERSDKAIYDVTNEKVAQFNQGLSNMTAGMDRVYFLDVSEPFWSSTGCLIEDGTGSNDGVHLGAAGYAIECDYIRTHTVK